MPSSSGCSQPLVGLCHATSLGEAHLGVIGAILPWVVASVQLASASETMKLRQYQQLCGCTHFGFQGLHLVRLECILN